MTEENSTKYCSTIEQTSVKTIKLNQTYSNDHDIKNVPESSEVVELVDLDLKHLLNNVVDDEENEQHFTQVHESIECRHISDQFHSSELPRGNRTASWGELQS